MKENKLMIVIIAAAVIIAGSLVFLGLKMGNNNSSSSFGEQFEQYQKDKAQAEIDARKKQLKEVLTINDDDHVEGDKKALITLYEYSDFECPFCKRFYKTPTQLIADNDGKVNMVYRHFNELHAPLSTREAIASECAAELGGNDVFFAYHDALYETTESNGRSLTKQPERGIDLNDLFTIASRLGLDSKEFKACYESDRHLDKINNDIQGARKIGVTGTPNIYIINNKTGDFRFIEGAAPIESFQSAINELLA